MKFNLHKLTIGLLVPIALTTSNFSESFFRSDQAYTVSVDKPYKIEIYNHKGEFQSEVSGVSNQTDPFLIAKELNVDPYLEDKFSAFPDIKMGIGSKITLLRAPEFKVKDGKKEYLFRSWAENVENLLKENSIEIGADDKINFSLDTSLESGMSIVIIRVAKTTVKESEAIKYNVVKKEDPDLEKGKSYVKQAGENGKKNLYYEVIREDGEEVSRTLKKTEVEKEPIDEILVVGTKIVSYGTGVASWYIDSSKMIGACNLVPKGTKIRVVNLHNGKSVEITASGGGLRSDRIVDLSTAAFQALGASLGQGIISNVRLEKIY